MIPHLKYQKTSGNHFHHTRNSATFPHRTCTLQIVHLHLCLRIKTVNRVHLCLPPEGRFILTRIVQDQEDNYDIELVQKCLPDQETFQTYNDIKDEGQCAPPLPQKVQQCSSAPVEDLTDKVVLLKSVQDSPVKATTSTEPTEESIKIPPDPTDESLTTTAYTSFHEPLAIPSIQAVDGLSLHRTDYQFLSNSFCL